MNSRSDEWCKPTTRDVFLKDFRFRDGQVFELLRLRFTSLGNPDGEPVLILHGTGGTGRNMLTPRFAEALFGEGRPLDVARHFVVLPDAIGHGGSAKPSDGLRMLFPRFDYEDMVSAQYRLVSEVLQLRHLRAILGISMGGMHAWLWGIIHPKFMDALVPLASNPAPMSGRNWLMRRLLIEAVQKLPQWNGGNYVEQPSGVREAWDLYSVATNGGTAALQAIAPNAREGDLWLASLRAPAFETDATDLVYQMEASRNYDPSARLDRIRARVLAINSEDDERNPVELGLAKRAVERLPMARFFLIPASGQTHGHSTVEHAALWAEACRKFLDSVPLPSASIC